jgi:protein-tyrosine phosphatase
MPDGEGTTPEMIRAYTQKLNDFVTKYGRTLVFCQAGQSRSPSLVAAYLARYRNMGLESALELVREARAPERDVIYWPATLTAIGEALEEV